MKSTSEQALAHFQFDLNPSGTKGMVDYSAHELQSRFHGNLVATALLLTSEDLEKTHALSTEKGPIPKRGGAIVEALPAMRDCKAVVIRSTTSQDLLIVWNDRDTSGPEMEVVGYHFACLKPEIDPAVTEDVEKRLATGTETFKDILPVAQAFAGNAFPVDLGDRYSAPTTLTDIIAKIRAVGIQNVGGRGWNAWATQVTHKEHATTTFRGISRHHEQRYEIVETLARTFEHGPTQSFELRDFVNIVKEGRHLEMAASVAAHAFERGVVGNLEAMNEFAEIAQELALGNGTVFAYADTDIDICAERLEDKDIFLHGNGDLNEQNAYVTVVNRIDGEPSSIDVYIAKNWHGSFLKANGLEEDEAFDRRNFNYLVEAIEDDADKLNTDQLIEGLKEGRPTNGLALTYDIAERSLEIHPAAYETGYLANVGDRFLRDLEMLRNVRDRKFDEIGLAEFQTHEVGSNDIDTRERVEAEAYLDSLTPRPAAGPRP